MDIYKDYQQSEDYIFDAFMHDHNEAIVRVEYIIRVKR